MTDYVIAAAIFIALSASSLGAMYVYPRMPLRHRDEETNAVVRLVSNLFVVMTSLVFGLLINSARTTYDNVDQNIHSYATNIILLDRSLRAYGLSGRGVRDKLVAYVAEAVAHPARADSSSSDTAGQALDAVGDALYPLQPLDSYHERLLLDIRAQYRRIVEQRWSIVEQSEGTIPLPLLSVLAAWLVLIFGSFGYRAPQNGVVVASLVVAAALIAVAFYLVLDMNFPFQGPIQISDAPLRRALAEARS